ncbi:hypothetical protein [Natrononativus amylolyticus]|uniref:hypothetical protein n=1 Tax=Natrononativus amylolyticus TaxID=2963434 RepID=UPI0020CBA4E5|nr:hypothetical protein [Natrononativus amylolyticus]
MDGPRFEERQDHPSWLLTAVGVCSLPVVALAAIAVLDGTTSTTAAAAPLGLLVTSIAIPLALIARGELLTRVDDRGLSIRYSPFHRSARRISFETIESLERGERRSHGYGIQWTRAGWEYVPDATEGIWVHRRDAASVFIGSERPHDLETAIRNGLHSRW